MSVNFGSVNLNDHAHTQQLKYRKKKSLIERAFRPVLLLAALFMVAALAHAGSDDAKSGQQPDSWRMFRGNSRLTGVVPGELPENPEPLWIFQAEDAIESTAAIDDGVVYFGSLDEHLYALDFATGELRWKIKVAAEIKASPTVHDGKVFFGDDFGVFRAVSAATGDSLWGFTTEGEIFSSANIYNGRVLFGSYDNFLYCLSARDGKLLWKLESEGYLHGMPAISDGKVFVTGCDGFFRTVDIESGKQIAEFQLGDYVAASPAIHNDQAFFGTFGNKVLCLNLTKSQLKWSYENPKRKFPYYSSAAVTDNIVVVGGRDKILHAFNPDSGDEVWAFNTRAKIESSPVIVGDKVLFASGRGTIYILDLQTGELLWQYDAGSSIVSSASFAKGKFLFGDDDGVMTCFGEKE